MEGFLQAPFQRFPVAAKLFDFGLGRTLALAGPLGGTGGRLGFLGCGLKPREPGRELLQARPSRLGLQGFNPRVEIRKPAVLLVKASDGRLAPLRELFHGRLGPADFLLARKRRLRASGRGVFDGAADRAGLSGLEAPGEHGRLAFEPSRLDPGSPLFRLGELPFE